MLEEVRATEDGRARSGDALGGRRAYGWRKLHSLTGIVPVGVFLLGHLWTQLAALSGRGEWETAHGGPFDARWVEIVFVLVPLAFHAAFGIVLAVRTRVNVAAYTVTRNWTYTAQRVSGLVTFAFVVWHVAHLWVPMVTGDVGSHQMYPKLEQDLSTTAGGFPFMAVAMMVGVGAASFHFANGVWGFALSTGWVRAREAQRRLAAVTVVLGIVLFAAGMDAVVYFATGARMWTVPRPSTGAGDGASR